MFDWKSEITWKDGVVPPDRQLEDREIIAISYSLFYCMCALTVLGIAFALYLVVFNVMNKEKRTIRMSSPKLNGAIILVRC
ncbi:gamma-aminobutyric acid type B receptor subunit 2-like [Saccoglossus kowalevskii]